MSLVSEALKKAEREAAARETRAKGLPAPFEAPLQPYRSRRGGGRSRLLVPALALFGGAAAIAIALLLLRPEGQEEAPVERAGTGAPEARALPLAPLATAPVHPDAAVAPSPASAAPATMPSASEPAAPPVATLPLPKATQRLPPSPPPSPSVSEPAAAKAAAPAKAVSQGAGDFLRSVEFADGTKLELGGIVYSEASPFAYLNGRLVGVGEFVLGRRIDRIERDRVILSGEGGEIILRLKTR